jgi:hypothetical protein
MAIKTLPSNSSFSIMRKVSTNSTSLAYIGTSGFAWLTSYIAKAIYHQFEPKSSKRYMFASER